MGQGLRLEIFVDDKGTATIQRVQGAFGRLENQVKGGAGRMAVATAALRARFNGLGAAMKRAGQIGKLVLAGLAIATVLVGAKFEQSMANVAAVASASKAELLELTGVARGLGAATAFSASQAAEAMMALAQAGQDVNQIFESTGNVLLFAGAANTSMGDAAETLVATLAQFKLGAEQSNRVVNVFAASMASSLLNAERLKEGLSNVGSVASGLELRLEETVAALGALNSAGMLGAVAGTRLKNTLVRLAAPNAVLKKALGGVSLEADGLVAVFRALKDADPAAIFKGFGRIAAPAVLVLSQMADELVELEEKITGTNKAQEMFDIQMNTVASQFKIFKSQLQENMIATFVALRNEGFGALEGMTQLLRDIKPFIVGVVVKTLEWFKANKDLIGNLAKGVGILAAVAAGVALLSSGWVQIALVVGLAITAWDKWGEAITDALNRGLDFARVFIESHQTAIAAVVGVFKGWINLTVGGFVFIGLRVKRLWDKWTERGRAALTWVTNRFREFVDFAGPVLNKLGIKLGETFDKIVENLKGPIEGAKDDFAAGHSDIVEDAKKAFGTDYAGALFDGVESGVNAAVTKIGELARKTKSIITSVVADIKKTGEAAGGIVISPRASSGGDKLAQMEKEKQDRIRIRMKEADEIIAQALRSEQAEAAIAMKGIARNHASTQEWLDARMALIEIDYLRQFDAAEENAEMQMEAILDKEFAIAEAKAENQDALINKFMENNQIMMAGIASLEAAWDTYFAGLAAGEGNWVKLRDASIRAMKATFIRAIADMVKFWIKQQLLGLLVTTTAQKAAADTEKVSDAKTGARKAYSAFANIPIIGPALGMAAAAAAFGFLMAFAQGGAVPGHGFGRDTIPAILEPEEFVIRRSSAQAVGRDSLDFINRTGSLPPGEGGGGVSFNLFTSASDSDATVEEITDYVEEKVLPAINDILERRGTPIPGLA